ncbi:Na+/H+ antiporter NhaA [Aurantimicrobium sp. MWH-Uga1]|uniref:Na+/H+ antiporter NhaA n=1 Tax=Aurantimicrobium sp. MWH-Uga1 TaxID=2079575 RepID=UPI000DF04A04|nr:Na+/H+ antiporter NhaA [Aurantimicrobium sp. MWH-Uga1]AXE54064.1 Na(+)/H(+) antiporter NhaA [Aurantimicrobium sp. MWH-Uga1]
MAKVSMKTIFRSERYAAISLAGAAALGLFLANSVAGPGLIELSHSYVGFPAIGLELSIAHWITDALLAVFFFIIAVELRHELTVGELSSFKKALAPGIAALGGVIVPALCYLAIAGPEFARGWPIPTATDIAFALGLIALVGRGLPGRLRVFLLALAVIDDLIAILIIAVFFTSSIDFIALGMAVFAVYLFRFISCQGRMNTQLQATLLVVVALFAWYFTYLSGVHATIAGVALGLVLQPRLAGKAAHALQPTTNAVILPLFAFVSALVVIPDLAPSELSPAFWGIAVGLPLGKIVGITIAGSIVAAIIRRGEATETIVTGWDVVTVSAVAGIGFTVSLLMNELAFADNALIRDEGVLGVLIGSAISIVIGGSLVIWRSRHYRKQR